MRNYPPTASPSFFLQKFSACSLVVNQRQEASRAPWCENNLLKLLTYFGMLKTGQQTLEI